MILKICGNDVISAEKMGSGRSKSCRGSSLARQDSEPPSGGGGGGGGRRRRKPMRLLCSIHSSCLASSSSHDSDDDVDQQVSFSSLMQSAKTRSN